MEVRKAGQPRVRTGTGLGRVPQTEQQPVVYRTGDPLDFNADLDLAAYPYTSSKAVVACPLGPLPECGEQQPPPDTALGLVPAVVCRAVAMADAGSARQLGHLGTRRRSAREVGVAANRRKRRRTSGKVMVGDGLEGRTAMLGAIAAAVSTVSVAVFAVPGRVERTVRRGRDVAAETRDAVVLGAHTGLPVDRRHAVLEARRGLELPLANDGPTDRDSADAGRDDDQDGEASLRGL